MNRRKFTVTLVLLVICLVLLVSVSYAWLSLTTAPEVAGMDTYIGANGSLEIALLSDTTYLDPSLIRSMVGDSMAIQEAEAANLTWGNVIDLSAESYGLGKISLRPSRLNVSDTGEGIGLGSSMLSYPQYGLDGRFGQFNANTVSAVFQNQQFVYSSESQSYGVRGIGPISGMTPQQAALASARSLVQSYTVAASRGVQSAWSANGAGIVDIFARRYGQGQELFTAEDVALIRDTSSRMQSVLSYIDLALRQGIIGYAASSIADEASFQMVRQLAENTVVPLSMLLEQLPSGIPSGMTQWIRWVDSQKQQLQINIRTCDTLGDGEVAWERLQPLVESLVSAGGIYIGQELADQPQAYQPGSLNNGAQVTLTSSSGIMGGVADYFGNYSVFFEYTQNISLEAISASTNREPYLTQIYTRLEQLSAPSTDEGVIRVPIQETYGYAIDMALRCNAATSELLLQTQPASRLDENTDNAQLQGGGSYMRFSSENLSLEQTVLLMDAIRVAFVSDQGKVLAVAKLNTSNYTEDAEGVSAYLYLYEYEMALDGSISMGQRRLEDNVITAMDQSVPVVITAVVWLDGDHVDNALAGVSTGSMTGSLNLQFSSSAQLQSSGEAVIE